MLSSPLMSVKRDICYWDLDGTPDVTCTTRTCIPCIFSLTLERPIKHYSCVEVK